MDREDERRERITAWERRLIRALCCTCGQSRTLRANYYGRNGAGDIDGPAFDNPEHLSRCQARGHFLEVQLYWRHLRTLKCSACREWTRHALVSGDNEPLFPGDVDELTNYTPHPWRTRGGGPWG